MVKHISFNPHFYSGVAGEPSIVMLIPVGYILDKVVPITEFEWVLVCHGDKVVIESEL